MLCEKFQKKFKSFRDEIQDIKKVVRDLVDSKNEEESEKSLKKLEFYKTRIEEIKNEIAQFKEKEYIPRATEIINKWWIKNESGLFHNVPYKFEYGRHIQFDEAGRAIILYGKIRFEEIKIRTDYFPSIVKKIIKLRVDNPRIRNLDYLEEIEEEFWFARLNANHLQSLKSLRKIGGFAEIPYNVENLESLEEVGGKLNISHIKINTIEEFKSFFPKLKKIGKDSDGNSIYLGDHRASLEAGLMELKNKGELQFEGDILYEINEDDF